MAQNESVTKIAEVPRTTYFRISTCHMFLRVEEDHEIELLLGRGCFVLSDEQRA